ncbi:hypothetical protein [Nitratireductor sp. OM-1]|uniref:hypothetical protein n=1 Tax=Nitratireductor sp. OM-1 TaxID=1756988 RepID=UPI0013AEFA38|nr:hypothetical protein [Nitratireductor sp. OM-1]
MDHKIRAGVGTLEHSTAGKERRLSEPEAWKAQREIESARHDEKWNAMEARIDTRFSGLEISVGDSKKTLSHISWLIMGGSSLVWWRS